MDAVNIALQSRVHPDLHRGPGPLPAAAAAGPPRPGARLRVGRRRCSRSASSTQVCARAAARRSAQLSAVVLLLQPYLTLRLARHFVPVSPAAVDRVAWSGSARRSSGSAIGTRGNPPMTALRRRLLRHRRGGRGVPALPRQPRHRVGYARTRLRIAAAATLCFAVGDPRLRSRSGGRDGGGRRRTRASPPSPGCWRSWPASATSPRSCRRSRCDGSSSARSRSTSARRFLGGAGRRRPGRALGRSCARGPDDHERTGRDRRARRRRRAVRVVDGTPPTAIQVGAPYAGSRAGATTHDRGRRATISLPIESDLGRQGWLIVYPDAGSLFLEDDLVLLQLLAGQAARADERREAIRQQGVLESELEDASQELRRLAGAARERGALPGRARGASGDPSRHRARAGGSATPTGRRSSSLGYVRGRDRADHPRRAARPRRRRPGQRCRESARRGAATGRRSRSTSRSARSNRAASCRRSRS